MRANPKKLCCRRSHLVIAALCWLSWSGPTRAQPAPSAAEDPLQLFQQGVALADEERWVEAAAVFERVCQLAPTPNAVFNLAAARFRQGLPLAALEALELLPAAPELSPEAQATATAMRKEFLGLVSILVWQVDPAHAEVRFDNRPVARGSLELKAMPGVHRVSAQAAGFRSEQADITLTPGERSFLRLKLTPAVSQAESPRAHRRRRWLWGTGALLVAGSALTVGLLLREPSKAREPCTSGTIQTGLGSCAQ